MRPKRIHIAATITLEGHMKNASFEGFAYVDAGFLAGRFIGPDNLDLPQATLLTVFTLTGCPIAARTGSPELCPWRETKGTYRGERVLEGEAFSASSVLVAHGSDDDVNMVLDVVINGNLPDLAAIDKPFQETIRQRSRGTLEGSFDIDFRDVRGRILPAKARTTYALPIMRDARDAWRNITILGYLDSAGFQQIEQIDLYGDRDEALEDLTAKRSVVRQIP